MTGFTVVVEGCGVGVYDMWIRQSRTGTTGAACCTTVTEGTGCRALGPCDTAGIDITLAVAVTVDLVAG